MNEIFIRYDGEKNPQGQYMPGLPLADMTRAEYDALSDDTRKWVDAQAFYIKQG